MLFSFFFLDASQGASSIVLTWELYLSSSILLPKLLLLALPGRRRADARRLHTLVTLQSFPSGYFPSLPCCYDDSICAKSDHSFGDLCDCHLIIDYNGI